ncbi:DEAD/DEAH box helicase [Cryobacterium sp. TmT2-59]|uniref:DEAD/DEAH box helicase n=2 Tax=Cryobacterium TaxID=69578 RepID=UPI00106B90F6|nr:MULTISPECIES: DEAD/DEAH box helicase [unclassified Cryobacterium]TFC85235.1 DEAD/DEAH box helicase [Cryobacterium sp. TmT2-59]TFD15816.1 DEAD/DEAH box helicase [Cryobacterium sp. TMT4-10]
MTFSELNIDQDMVQALADKGIIEPFPIQVQTIPLALSGQDIIGQAKTGTGKTLGFGLPIIQRLGLDPAPGVQVLVVVPTRELCVQVSEDLEMASGNRNTKVVSIYGGKAYEGQIEALKAGAQIVVGTPGRLLDLASQRLLSLANVTEMVLDEADKMLDLGFLADIEKLFSQTPSTRHTMLFSATMPGPIVALARRFMNRPIHIRASDPDEGLMQANIEHLVYRAHNMDKDEVIGRILMADGRGKTVIFTRTKRAAAKLVEELGDRGFNATAVHGDLNQEQRERAMASFKAGKKDILIATDVAARGIDVDDVTHVINHTIPEDEKAYLHRVGRTGRAGKTGIAVTFVDWDDMHKWTLINNALDFGTPVPMETYSSSPHLYTDLNIPAGSKGRLRASPIRETAASAGRSDAGRSAGGRTGGAGRSGAARSDAGRSDSGRSAAGRSGAGHSDAARSGASRSGEQAGGRPPRSRTRVGSGTNPDAPATAPAAGTHDGGGAEHHDGNSAPRRRSRTRRHAPQAGTPS